LTFSLQSGIVSDQEDRVKSETTFVTYMTSLFVFCGGLGLCYAIYDEMAGRPADALAIGDLTFRTLLIAARGVTTIGLIGCIVLGFMILRQPRKQRTSDPA
jgi:hypothetical protein